jgi:anti-sigma factor RsiW
MSTSCLDIRNELSAYADGQLEANNIPDIERHLAQCVECSKEFAHFKSVGHLIRDSIDTKNLSTPDIWEGMKDSLPSICELMVEDLSAYLDGELTPAGQEGVNRHLNECQPCLSQFKTLNATNQLITRGLELAQDHKVDLWPGVKAQLNQDCALINTELSAYADQEVATLRHRAITQHLTDCEGCRNDFNHLASVGDLVRDSYRPAIPDDFNLWPQIRNKLQVVPFAAKQKTLPMRTFSRQAMMTLAAAAVIAMFGSLTVWMMTPKTNSIQPISSESYLIESALMEPTNIADAVVYGE